MRAGRARGWLPRSAVPNHHLLVQRAERLVDPRARPHVEEWRALQGQELPPITLLRLLLALAGSRRLLVSADAALVIDGGVLDVAVVVPARMAGRPAAGEIAPPRLACDILGAAGVPDVRVEGHTLGEPLSVDDAPSHALLLGAPGPLSPDRQLIVERARPGGPTETMF